MQSPATLPATAPAASAPLPVAEDGLLPLPAPLAQLLTLLDAPGRAGALAELQASGHVDAGTLPRWRALLSERTLAPRYVNDALVRVRLGVDRLLAANGGELTAGKTRAILARQIELAARCGEGARFELATLQHTAVLDYGAGRFSPLSAALVLWANGAQRVVAYEPFALHVEMAVASAAETLRWLMFTPSEFAFSGLDTQAMKRRLAALDLDDLAARLERMNRGEVDRVDLGGVAVTRCLPEAQPDAFGLVYSNSVLEHVAQLDLEMQRLARIVAPSGLCLHTVDYADHRPADAPQDLFRLYYDGVLDGINGLRPPQLESALFGAGFRGRCVARTLAPAAAIQRGRGIVSPYSAFSDEALAVHVGSYALFRHVPETTP